MAMERAVGAVGGAISRDRLGKVAPFLRRAPVIPLFIVLVFLISAIFADVITRYEPNPVHLRERLQPPVFQAEGSWDYPLGTDPLGRDILTRVIYGARVSLIIAALALVMGGGIGTIIGLIAGYKGGITDTILMRAADITLTFPIILLAILLVMVLGASMMNVVISMGLILWARYARVIRGECLGLMQRDFIARSRVAGASGFRIMVRHLFPNIIPTLTVMLTLQVGWVIVVEASLSFIGAGIPPPTAAWGSMIAQGREYITTAWYVTTFPGLAIAIVVLAFNLMGDWLRERLDPKLRNL